MVELFGDGQDILASLLNHTTGYEHGVRGRCKCPLPDKVWSAIIVLEVNMIHSLIGILGGCLLAACGIPQAIKTLKDGHAKGLALNFMLMLIAGISLMGIYIYLEHGFDWIIHTEYSISVAVWSISLWYYFFPRQEKTKNTVNWNRVTLTPGTYSITGTAGGSGGSGGFGQHSKLKRRKNGKIQKKTRRG